MPSSTNIWALLRSRRDLLICLVAIALIYAFYISGLATNPPGFYLDESGGAYNAFLIATTGKSEFGVSFPLYFQFYTQSAIEYSNQLHIYLMAVMYLFVRPSVVSARIMAASTVFVATILLGVLAGKASGRRSVGIIVALTAIATPWLFEASRLVLEVSVYPLCLVLFLLCVYNAKDKPKWSLLDNALLGATLGLLTYSYTIGRLFGPMMALGLIIFGLNRKAFLNVLRTWVAYAIALIPLAVFYLSNPNAISSRFKRVTYISADNSLLQNAGEFLQSYFTDISPDFLLYSGDPLLRHHVPGMGGILAATFVLAIVGLILVIVRHRSDPWWRVILYGLIVSVIPGALTVQRYHSLRLIAFPVFLILLTTPALMWLIGERRKKADLDDAPRAIHLPGFARAGGIAMLCLVLVLTLFQAVQFQRQYAEVSPTRNYVFDEAYPSVLDKALAGDARPIYLEDGQWGPAYIHALWYATIQGVDLSNFVHLAEKQLPPEGSVVISSNTTCFNCEVIFRNGYYLLYRFTGREGMTEPTTPSVATSDPAPTPVSEKFTDARRIAIDARTPRGIAVDKSGNIYVADSGNARVQKLSPNGELLAVIGAAGTGEGELSDPTGVVVDTDGSIYVTDGAKKRVVKFNADGAYVQSLDGPGGGFNYPTDLAFGTDKFLYVTDKGRSQIIKIDPKSGATAEWGMNGSGDGEFASVFGIEAAGSNIYVADTQNDRIQVFGLDGKFTKQWPVTQWAKYIWHRPDVAVDMETKRVYVTSGWSHEVLVFDLEGNFVESLKPSPPAMLNNPSSVLLSGSTGSRNLYVLSTASDVVDTGLPSILVFNLPDASQAISKTK